MAQRLFKVVALTRTVMLSKAKYLPQGVRGRPFAGAQGDNEKAWLHGRIHNVCGFHFGISLVTYRRYTGGLYEITNGEKSWYPPARHSHGPSVADPTMPRSVTGFIDLISR